ncbi:MAG: hypothetical protein HYR90_00875 [Candidatus Andersenbacteria bacterium]|nr:hypothetical protein [Candidatus Andersenbacteria bacterium]MBI3251198.1 hypothetical protein [Candidatus Andersenbacteria bacterium]
MSTLKPIGDLPAAQQQALFVILRFHRPGFRTSEIRDKVGKDTSGRSIGAVLGALYRNGYLEKIAGGRDKLWKLAAQVEETRNEVAQQLVEVKSYWSK